MVYDGFDFLSDSLSYSAIENPICKHYNLGFASSSDFTELVEGKSIGVTIIGTKGSVACGVVAYKDKNSGLYKVQVSRADVKYRK